MIRVEAENVLRRMVAEAGYDLDSAPDLAAWEVFKEFARMPVEDVDATMAGDLLMFETWTGRSQIDEVDWGEPHAGRADTYGITFTRQFLVLNEQGEYAGMEMLTLDFEFPLTPELASLPAEGFTAVGGPPIEGEASADDWIRRVDRSRALQTARGQKPSSWSIVQERA